jgi:hypothetical protein
MPELLWPHAPVGIMAIQLRTVQARAYCGASARNFGNRRCVSSRFARLLSCSGSIAHDRQKAVTQKANAAEREHYIHAKRCERVKPLWV